MSALLRLGHAVHDELEDIPEAPKTEPRRRKLGKAAQALAPKQEEQAFRSPLLEPSALPKKPPGVKR